MGEAVGEVAERPALRVELPLEVAGRGAGLDPGEARTGRRRRAPGPSRDEVERDDRAPLLRRSLEAAGDAGAAAERDEHRVGVERRAQDRRDLVLVGRPDDRVREPAEFAAAMPDEVAQALAAGVHHAVERIGRHEAVAHGLLERRTQVVAQLRLEGPSSCTECRRVRAERLVDVEFSPRCSMRNGRKAGLGLSSWCEREHPLRPSPTTSSHRARPRRGATAVMPRPYSTQELGGWDSNPQPIGLRALIALPLSYPGIWCIEAPHREPPATATSVAKSLQPVADRVVDALALCGEVRRPAAVGA